MSRKSKIFIGITIGISIVIFVFALTNKTRTASNSSQISSSRGNFEPPTPIPVAITTMPAISKNELNLIDINPRESVLRSVWGVEPIILYFDADVDLKTVQVISTPDAGVKFELFDSNPRALSIYPFNGWENGVKYNILVSKGMKSKDGKVLTKDIDLTFTKITPSPGDSDYPTIPNENN